MDHCSDAVAMDVDEHFTEDSSCSGLLALQEQAKRTFCDICSCESFSSYEMCPHLLASCDIDDDLKAFLKEYSPRSSISFGIEPQPAAGSLECEFCHILCKNLKGLRQHIGKMHEPKKKQSQCPQCEKRFKNKYAVRFHQKQVHDKTTRVSCPHCSKTMYNKYWLQEHIQTAHALR